MSFFRRIFGKTEEEERSVGASRDETGDNKVETREATDNDDTAPFQPQAPVEEEADGLVELNGETIADVPDVAMDTDDGEEEPALPYISAVTHKFPTENNVNIHQPSQGHIVFGQTSDRGLVRNNNQDADFCFFTTGTSAEPRPDFGLFVVADGMGGHQHGEKASALTARVVADVVLNTIYMPMLRGASFQDSDQPSIAEALTESVKRANREVREQVEDGGTTLTAIVVVGNLAHLAHVGDSRAYLITEDNEIEQITRDHSLVQRLKELGQITEEESHEHQQRNVLYRAIGQNPEIEVDVLTRRLPSASRILICSDGLWGAVEEDDIVRIVREPQPPQDACDRLIALANNNGGHDNITAVIFHMPDN